MTENNEKRGTHMLTVREILVGQMNYWILFTLAVTLKGMFFGAPPVMWRYFIAAFVPIICFLLRMVKHTIVFLLGHVALMAVFVFMPRGDFMDWLFAMILVAGLLIYSFMLRIRVEDRMESPMHPLLAAGIAVVGMLIQVSLGDMQWLMYYVIPLVVFLMFYFIQIYIVRYLDFLKVNDSSAGRIPQDEIFRCGMLLVIAFSIGSALLMMAISGMSFIREFVDMIGKAFMNFIRFIASLRRVSDDETEEIIEEAEEMGEGMGFSDMVEYTEPAPIWEILQRVVIVLFAVGIAAAAVYGLYKLLKYLYERLSIRTVMEEEELASGTDTREKCQVERSARRERRSVFSVLSAQERIRRVFKKTVWNSRSQIIGSGSEEILSTMTARECGNKLDKDELAKIYEKARYSGEECTSEDVRRAREAAREK